MTRHTYEIAGIAAIGAAFVLFFVALIALLQFDALWTAALASVASLACSSLSWYCNERAEQLYEQERINSAWSKWARR